MELLRELARYWRAIMTSWIAPRRAKLRHRAGGVRGNGLGLTDVRDKSCYTRLVRFERYFAHYRRMARYERVRILTPIMGHLPLQPHLPHFLRGGPRSQADSCLSTLA